MTTGMTWCLVSNMVIIKKQSDLWSGIVSRKSRSFSQKEFLTVYCLHAHKNHKNALKRTKTKKVVLNTLKKHLRGRKLLLRYYALLCFDALFCVCKNKKDSIFMRIKTSKRKKIACLTFCAFCDFYAFWAFCALYAHKKHLSESCLFAFCTFCTFFFVCEIFSWKKNLFWYPHLYYYSSTHLQYVGIKLWLETWAGN